MHPTTKDPIYSQKFTNVASHPVCCDFRPPVRSFSEGETSSRGQSVRKFRHHFFWSWNALRLARICFSLLSSSSAILRSQLRTECINVLENKVTVVYYKYGLNEWIEMDRNGPSKTTGPVDSLSAVPTQKLSVPGPRTTAYFNSWKGLAQTLVLIN